MTGSLNSTMADTMRISIGTRILPELRNHTKKGSTPSKKGGHPTTDDMNWIKLTLARVGTIPELLARATPKPVKGKMASSHARAGVPDSPYACRWFTPYVSVYIRPKAFWSNRPGAAGAAHRRWPGQRGLTQAAESGELSRPSGRARFSIRV